MELYHKIQTVFKRDPETRFKTLLEGEFSIPEFEYLKDSDWTFTEKVDGTNIRVMFEGLDTVSFGGKTDRAQIPAELVNRLNHLFTADNMKSVFGAEAKVCLYGEGHGAKIQKDGGNYSDTQDFVLFDVNCGGMWLKREDVRDIATNLGIDVVPVLGIGNLSEMVEKARGGFTSGWGGFMAEGIVARPTIELLTRRGDRIITKIKRKDFDLSPAGSSGTSGV